MSDLNQSHQPEVVASGTDAFADPVGYLAGFGIQAELIEPPALPEAA
jgi:hypothetical protein